MDRSTYVVKGEFGRSVLLHINYPLVEHAHEHLHMLFVLSDTPCAFDIRGQRHNAGPNRVILVNSGEPHKFIPPREGASACVLAVYLEPEWLKRVFRLNSGFHWFSANTFDLNAFHQGLLQQLVTCLTTNQTSCSMSFEVILEIIVKQLNTDMELLKPRNNLGIADFRIRRAIEMMDNDLGEVISLDQVARAVGMSRQHFYERFRDSLHMTPNQYYNMRRMNAALDRLAKREVSITHLAHDLGFSSSGNFTRFFKTFQGTTPMEYRQNLIS